MFRKTLFVLLLLSLFSAESFNRVLANEAPIWYAEIYPGLLFRGEPVTRQFSGDALRQYWGEGRPDQRINHDYFSAKFFRTVTNARATQYKFIARGDDGYRIFINGNLLLDQNSGTPLEKIEVTAELPAGSSRIYVEYYEMIGNASIDIQFYPTGAVATPDDNQATCEFDWFWSAESGHESCPGELMRQTIEVQEFKGGFLLRRENSQTIEAIRKVGGGYRLLKGETFAQALANNPDVSIVFGAPLAPATQRDARHQCDSPGKAQESLSSKIGCYTELLNGQMIYKFVQAKSLNAILLPIPASTP